MSVEGRWNPLEDEFDKNNRDKEVNTLPNPVLHYNSLYIKNAHVDKDSITDHYDPNIDFKLGYRHDVKNQRNAPRDVENEINGKRVPTTFKTPLTEFNKMLAAGHKRPLGWNNLTRQATNPKYYGYSAQSRTLLNTHAPVVSSEDDVAFRGALEPDTSIGADKYNRPTTNVNYTYNGSYVLKNNKPFHYGSGFRFNPTKRQQKNWLINDTRISQNKLSKVRKRFGLSKRPPKPLSHPKLNKGPQDKKPTSSGPDKGPDDDNLPF